MNKQTRFVIKNDLIGITSVERVHESFMHLEYMIIACLTEMFILRCKNVILKELQTFPLQNLKIGNY